MPLCFLYFTPSPFDPIFLWGPSVTRKIESSVVNFCFCDPINIKQLLRGKNLKEIPVFKNIFNLTCCWTLYRIYPVIRYQNYNLNKNIYICVSRVKSETS